MRLGLGAVCFVLCGSSVLLSGCSSLPWSSVEAERVTGLLEKSEEGWTIQRCRDGSNVRLGDTTKIESLFQRVAQPGQVAIFADMEVSQRGSGSFRAGQVLRMQSSGRGCADEPQAGQWIVWGIDDSWRLVVGPQGIRFSGVADQESGPVRVVSESLPDGAMSVRGADDDDLELWLYPQDCFDNSGRYRHMTATLTVNGRRLNGCAYKGADAGH